MSKPLTYMIGKAVLFASMQFAIGSVEMSSKFSVKNFSKDQITLDHAMVALSDYIVIALVWTLGTSFIFYTNYGIPGLITNIICNGIIITWITLTYKRSFQYAAKKYGLVEPKLFHHYFQKSGDF
jgi:hypothetical protein